jgi:hypothetical protein
MSLHARRDICSVNISTSPICGDKIHSSNHMLQKSAQRRVSSTSRFRRYEGAAAIAVATAAAAATYTIMIFQRFFYYGDLNLMHFVVLYFFCALFARFALAYEGPEAICNSKTWAGGIVKILLSCNHAGALAAKERPTRIFTIGARR